MTCLNVGGGISDPAPGGLHKISSLLGRKMQTRHPSGIQPNIRLNTLVSTTISPFSPKRPNLLLPIFTSPFTLLFFLQTPMPFYADPNRFPTPVWQADPTQGNSLDLQNAFSNPPLAVAWTQGQFIQQIPAGTQPTLETYQQYPNGIYQTTYQQPAFETNTFYTGAVQVLTNTRPPSTPNQTQLTPRPNSNYSHTPSPAPTNRQYQEYNPQNQNFVSPATTPSGNTENISRPSSVNSTISNPTNNQNFSQSSTNFTSVSSATFSPNSNPNYATANSGNAQPGYPQVNSSPQLVSHNSSGYPGNEQFSGTSHDQIWQEDTIWERPQEAKNETEAQTSSEFSQADRVNLNTRIKTMILSKQQENTDEKKVENTTGHFLWYSHHHRFGKRNDGGGFTQPTTKPKQLPKKHLNSSPNESEIPKCNCFHSGQVAAEPGTYYTHLGSFTSVPCGQKTDLIVLGCSNNLTNLRNDLENRTGVKGRAIRIEKIKYTGKEGKTAQGCPIAKWVRI